MAGLALGVRIPAKARECFSVARRQIDCQGQDTATCVLGSPDSPERFAPYRARVELKPDRPAARGVDFLDGHRAHGREYLLDAPGSGSSRDGKLAFGMEGSLRAAGCDQNRQRVALTEQID